MNFYGIITRTIAVLFLCVLTLIIPLPVESQSYPANQANLRSFEELFPGYPDAVKDLIFNEPGLIHSPKKNESLVLIPAAGSGIDLHSAIMKSNPSYFAESLLVVPYSGRLLDRLDAYNALGNVRGLKGRLYHSFTRKEDIPLFEDATRLESAKKTNPIPDPPPAAVLPYSETVYIRLKDANFGNSFYRAEISTSPYGVIYNLANTKSLTYLLFTAIKEERFNAILYLEPLTEGMLVYSMAGADASNFISNRIDIPSAISKRLAVFIGWISDGLIAIR